MRNIAQSIASLPSLIAEKIKDVFVPDPDVLQDSIDTLKDDIMDTFGIDYDDIGDAFGEASSDLDLSTTFNLYGLSSFNAKYFDSTYLVEIMDDLNPYIRAFLVILLIFYNLKQFMTLFNISPSSGGDDDDN